MSVNAAVAPFFRIKPLPVLCIVSALLMLAIWVPRLHEALFVDEAGSYWIIHGGMRNVIGRTIATEGETPLYYLALAVWSRLFGFSEAAMRSLSCAATAGTLLSLLWLGRIRESWACYFAVPILAASRLVVFSAVTARPYAMGIFFAVLSIAAFAHWLRHRSKFFLYFAAASYGFALNCHLTVGVALAVHLYLLWERKPSRAELLALGAPLLLGLLAASPALFQAFSLTARVHDLSIISVIPDLPSIARFFVSFPVFLTLILACVIFILRWTILCEQSQWNFSRKEFGLAGTWFFVPKFFVFFVALFISPTFFVPRYSLFACIGEALLAGAFLAAITNRFWRLGLAAAVIAVMGVRGFFMWYPDTAWRPALDYIRQHDANHECGIFASVGFIESKRLDLMTTEPTASFIASPLAYYHLDDAVLLPFFASTPAEEEYIKKSVYPAVDNKKCAILLRWDMGAYDSMPTSGPGSLTAHLAERNFKLVSESELGSVTLFHWQAPN